MTIDEDTFILFDGMWNYTTSQLQDLRLNTEFQVNRKNWVRDKLIEFEDWKEFNVQLGRNVPVEFDETYVFSNKYSKGRLTSW